jgi:hypothetical protein
VTPHVRSIAIVVASVLWVGRPFAAAQTPAPADLRFTAYRDVLRRVVHNARVDYRTLAGDRGTLDRVALQFAEPAGSTERTWSARDRMAFWINAYNFFTLQAIVAHYPIRGSLFSRSPRNSIRQIDGVWTTLKWRAAGRDLTLDQIEHGILRPEFGDARVHMAVNCASKSCPPLSAEPYIGADLDRQLDDAARRYLAGPAGARVVGGRLRVSSIFKWYGDDFVKAYAPMHPGTGAATDRAIRGFVERYGPPDAAAAAKAGSPLAFLDYDWSLNDIDRPSARD